MDEIQRIMPSVDDGQTRQMIRRWFVEDCGAHNAHVFDDNQKMCQWFQSQFDNGKSLVNDNLESLRKNSVNNQLKK